MNKKKYELQQDALWYPKGTQFWFEKDNLFVYEPNDKPMITLDELFNVMVQYFLKDYEEYGDTTWIKIIKDKHE